MKFKAAPKSGSRARVRFCRVVLLQVIGSVTVIRFVRSSGRPRMSEYAVKRCITCRFYVKPRFESNPVVDNLGSKKVTSKTLHFGRCSLSDEATSPNDVVCQFYERAGK